MKQKIGAVETMGNSSGGEEIMGNNTGPLENMDNDTGGFTLSGQDENIVKVEMDDKLKQFIVNG
jgi:hypothetical protein